MGSKAIATTAKIDDGRSVGNPGNTILTQSSSISESALKVWAEIKRLELQPYVAELDVLGLTVLPPIKAAPAEFLDEMREAVFQVIEKRGHKRPDLAKSSGAGENPDVGEMYWYILLENPVFRRALVNPVVLALVTYLLGENALLGHCSALLKSKGKLDLQLHADTVRESAPFPPHAQGCNVTYCLTDWNRENGATCYVPGSHQYFRHPLPGEDHGSRVPVVASAGSIIFWNANTWHGAFARSAPGIRMSVIMPFYRPHWRTLESYKEQLTEEVANEHPRIASLLGSRINWPFKEEGPKGGEYSYTMGRHAYD